MDKKTSMTRECGSSVDKKQKRKRQKKLLCDIQRQVEFYFSDSNLRKDRFIKQEMQKAKDGYIDISTILSFNRMRALTSDQTLVVRALDKSELLKVSEDKTKIKRKKPLEKSKYNEDDVTVYVENLPHNVDHDMLRKVFSPCGNIAYISLPRFKVSGDPKRFAFIEFTTPQEATKACKLLNNPPSDKHDVDGCFPLTRKGKLILPDYIGKRQQESKLSEKDGKEKTSKRKREASETEEVPPSDAVKVTKKQGGVKENATREGNDKVIKAPKRKRQTIEVIQNVDDGAQKEKKMKKHDRRSVQEEARRDAETPASQKDQKTAKKRRHSGGETHAGQRSDIDAKADVSAKDRSKKAKKAPMDDLDTHKRKRDDSISSIDSTKDKRSAGHKDDTGEVKETKRRRGDSEMSADEDGDKKKRRSRSRKHKRDEAEDPLMQISVIPKKEWLELKKKYLAMQKASRIEMKQALKERSQNGQKGSKTNNKEQIQVADVKMKSTEPEFVPGVVLKISSDKPFSSRKTVKEQLEVISPVAYIDLKDGDTSGFVRLQSAEGAKAILGKAETLSTDSGHFEVALVSGQDEQMYWDKLKADRLKKLSQTHRKKKKRGVERILDKTEKIMGSSRKSKKIHIHFDKD